MANAGRKNWLQRATKVHLANPTLALKVIMKMTALVKMSNLPMINQSKL